MVVREFLRMQKQHFYLGGNFEFVPRWDKCISLLGNCVEETDASRE
jgi:hypothetical protein